MNKEKRSINCRFLHFWGIFRIKKNPRNIYVSGICFVLLLLLSGATKNRTRDTRIFSPLLSRPQKASPFDATN